MRFQLAAPTIALALSLSFATGENLRSRVLFSKNIQASSPADQPLTGGNEDKSTPFDALVELLQDTYDNQCIVMATGLLPATPTVTVQCTMPGGKATLFAEGAGENAVAKTLEVCSLGAFAQENCETIDFTGNAEEDFARALQLIQGGPDVDDDIEFEILVDFMNETFSGYSCFYMATMDSVSYRCDSDETMVILSANGTGTEAVPNSFTKCDIIDDQAENCESIELTGDTEADIALIANFISENNEGSFEALVDLMNETYDGFPCFYMATMNSNAYRCDTDDTMVILSADGVGGDEVATSLEKCDIVDGQAQDCESIELTNDVESDLESAVSFLSI